MSPSPDIAPWRKASHHPSLRATLAVAGQSVIIVNMECTEALKTRRSVRAYTGEPVSREVIEDIVDCGRLAATAVNIQPWEFVVVTAPPMLRAIAAATDFGRFIAQAAACIVVLCRDTKYYLEDGCNASQNILVAAEIDPVYLDASYYVVPETAGEKPYTLLYEVLRRSGHAAVAQWTCHNREYLVLLRPGRFGLLLHTLFYADEVRALDEFRTEVEWVSARELELAGLLVEALAARFEPAKYRDTYRENVRAMLDAKIRGEELKREEPAPPPVAVLDILEGLKASLARAKKPAAGARRSPARLPAAAAH